MTKEMKTNIMTQAAAVKTQCLLHFEVCLAARSTGWAHHCGTTLRPSVFLSVICSHRMQRWP